MKLCQECRKAGRVWCPHSAAYEMKARLSASLKQEMFGPTPPGFFVGHSFYPKVFFGPMISATGEPVADDPKQLYGMSIPQIMQSRLALVRGMARGEVGARGRLLSESQLAVMSIKPVDAEAKFSRQPFFKLEFDEIAQPVGVSAPIEKFLLAENPPVPKKVDSAVSEGMEAEEAIGELLASGFDVHYLSRLLAAGLLGKPEQRKMVPTKWAITATDDIAAKRLIGHIKDFRQIEAPLLYSNIYLDNRFEILLLPGSWEYEQFEAYLKSPGKISEEHEPFGGRKKYAESQGGGYYAARFAVAEGLWKMGRQAKAVVFREIGEKYDVPVGVWEVRENVRHAFSQPPEKFSSLKEALARLSAKLALPISNYLKKSRVLLQRRLDESWDRF